MNEAKYREAERSVWSSLGLSPTEHRVRIPSTGTSVRVQSVGEGEPVLYLHGGPNAGTTWAMMLPEMTGFRSLLVDRPGTGLSDDFVLGRGNELLPVADRFVGEVLDGLGIERAHVVASSFGGFLALRSAAAHPERFRRMVQMACPAMAMGSTTPPFMLALRSPFVRWIAPKLPPSRKRNDDILRQIGHGKSIDEGRIPEGFNDWYVALQRHTNTMKNDMAMIGAALSDGEGAFDPAYTLDREVLGRVCVPTLFLWGEDDGFGRADVARATADAIPGALLELLPDSGHLPWLDDPHAIGARTAAFLRAA